MKITHNKVGQNLNVTDTKTDKSDSSKRSGSSISPAASGLSDVGAAKVDLSSRAQEAKKIKDLAMAAPDVDTEKVERLQKMIDAGDYKIDAKAIADKMVDEHLETAE
jgi:negative regulator of flagellin synthesis FlgM